MLHSYDPGNGGVPNDPAGLYWTLPVNPAVLSFPAANEAVVTIKNLSVLDHFQENTLAGALGTLDCTVTWSGDLAAISHNGTDPSGYKYIFKGVQDTVSLSMTVTSQVSQTNWSPFEFQPTGGLVTNFALLGAESNGVYG